MKYIPEGATHTAPGGTYRMLKGGYWREYADGDWILIKSPAPHLYTPIEDEIVELKATKVVEWDGVGDPPVGIECEWFPTASGRVKVKILGRDGSDTWYRVVGEEHPKTCRHMAFLRPARTAEQAAAEEIRSIIESGLNGNKTMTMVVKEIIEAGYRKQVEK